MTQERVLIWDRIDTNRRSSRLLVLAFAVVLLPVAAYVLLRFASAIVVRLSGARPVTRAEEPELWRTVENLCIGAGLPQPRLHVVESGAANAFATGLDPERASLVVTRGLMGLLDRREIEAVLV